MPDTVGAGNAQGKSQNHWKKGGRQLRLPMMLAARIGVYGDEMDQCDPTVVMAGRQQGDSSAVAGQKVFQWGDVEPNSASSKEVRADGTYMWKLWGRKVVVKEQSKVQGVWRKVRAGWERGLNEAGEAGGGRLPPAQHVRPVQEFIFCSTCNGKILKKCNCGRGLMEFILETYLLAVM